MLKGRGGGEEFSPLASQANLAPFECLWESVPPFLEEILDVEDSGLLRGYKTRLLRTAEALAEIFVRVRRDFLPHCRLQLAL